MGAMAELREGIRGSRSIRSPSSLLLCSAEATQASCRLLWNYQVELAVAPASFGAWLRLGAALAAVVGQLAVELRLARLRALVRVSLLSAP